jgi:hypothetical protein
MAAGDDVYLELFMKILILPNAPIIIVGLLHLAEDSRDQTLPEYG